MAEMEENLEINKENLEINKENVETAANPKPDAAVGMQIDLDENVDATKPNRKGSKIQIQSPWPKMALYRADSSPRSQTSSLRSMATTFEEEAIAGYYNYFKQQDDVKQGWPHGTIKLPLTSTPYPKQKHNTSHDTSSLMNVSLAVNMSASETTRKENEVIGDIKKILALIVDVDEHRNRLQMEKQKIDAARFDLESNSTAKIFTMLTELMRKIEAEKEASQANIV